MPGYASLATALAGMRRGAYDHLRQASPSDDLTRVLRHGLDQRRLTLSNRGLLRDLDAVNRDLMARVSLATDELAAFVSLGRDFERAGSPLAMLEQVVRAAAQLAGATDGGLFQRRSDGCVRCVVAAGGRAGELQRADLAAEPLAREALATGEPALQPHLLHDPVTATGPLALAGFNAALVVPLPGAAATTGALVLLDSEKGFTERQAGLVKAMAAYAAEIIPAVRAAPIAPAAADDEDFVDLQDLLGRGL